MAAQDDARELELLRRFNLDVAPERRRADIDGTLSLTGENKPIPFELKSTTGKAFSTVRDFGPDHVRKWAELHWIFGVYSSDGNQLLYCHYASPSAMQEWIQGRVSYVLPDTVLAGQAPALITQSMVEKILGDREVYTLTDAKSIQKNQYSAQDYRERQDVPGGYSRAAMLSILQDRCRYLILRGATLNNPKIPLSYFQDWERITENHAGRLRELVRNYLAG